MFGGQIVNPIQAQNIKSFESSTYNQKSKEMLKIDSLINIGKNLVTHLIEGDCQAAMEDINQSKQGIAQLKSNIQQKIKSFTAQQASMNSQISATVYYITQNTEKRNRNNVDNIKINLGNEGQCSESLRIVGQNIPIKEQQLQYQHNIVRLQSKKAVYGGRLVILKKIIDMLKKVETKYKMLKITLETIDEIIDPDFIEEVVGEMESYFKDLSDIQNKCHDDLQTTANYKPNIQQIGTIIDKVIDFRQMQVRCIIGAWRYQLKQLINQRQRESQEARDLIAQCERKNQLQRQRYWAEVQRIRCQELRKKAEAQKRRQEKRSSMFDKLNAQIQTMGSADCIKDGFRSAISYARNHPEIVSSRHSWYCGLFWSGAEYDIILYDENGNWRQRFYNSNRLGDP